MSEIIGKSIPKYDGLGHVTGTTTYVDDVHLPGMLYVKMLRSPVHKGIIRTLDVSAADNTPGVAAVITAKDIPGKNALWDPRQPVLVEKDIRFKGEMLAAVAAVDEDTAMEAVEKIKLYVEEQTPVFDPLEAMKPDAPKVYPDGNILKFSSGDCRKIRKGDVEKGFAEADEIVEETYLNKMNDHASMEPHCSVAYIDGHDRLTIYTVSQARSFHIGMLCAVFDLPISKLHLIGGTIGGGFGGKNEIHADHVAGLLALKTRKPVKYRWSRQEDLLYSTKRNAFIWEYKSGVKKDGQVTAHKIRAIHDIGAYGGLGDYAVSKPCLYAAGPFDVPNMWYDGYTVFTNKPVGSSMRAYLGANVTHAVEMQMNRLAEAIGMDPWEIRFINAWREGDYGPTMWKVTSCGLVETMKKAAELSGIELPAHLKAITSEGR